MMNLKIAIRRGGTATPGRKKKRGHSSTTNVFGQRHCVPAAPNVDKLGEREKKGNATSENRADEQSAEDGSRAYPVKPESRRGERRMMVE